MRAYIATTAVIFGLVFLAHLFRLYMEGMYPLHEVWWVLLTLLALALTIWGFGILRRFPRP